MRVNEHKYTIMCKPFDEQIKEDGDRTMFLRLMVSEMKSQDPQYESGADLEKSRNEEKYRIPNGFKYRMKKKTHKQFVGARHGARFKSVETGIS